MFKVEEVHTKHNFNLIDNNNMLMLCFRLVIRPKIYISTPWYWTFYCVIQYLSDSTLRTSICAQYGICMVLCYQLVLTQCKE